MKTKYKLYIIAWLGLIFLAAVTGSQPALAADNNNATGLEATVSSAPPSRGATITTPSNGQTAGSSPVTINGICPNNLLVKVFDNEIFVGSVVCSSGSYSLQVSLFDGTNEVVARVYDQLDQAGPDSNKVSVNYNDVAASSFGSHLSLTSNYARLGATPGDELQWPLVLSGGEGPYALSVDWGDNSALDLQSESYAGAITIKHTYQSAGVYRVIVKVTDHNGSTAFLQLVGVASGKVTQATQSATNGKSGSSGATQVRTMWWPAATTIPLIGVGFWLGGRSKLISLRHRLENLNLN